MADYRLATEQERKTLAPELVGQGHVIVFDKEKFWIVKHLPNDTKVGARERLGYQLGCDFANVAEVRILSSEEHNKVKTVTQKGEDSLQTNTCLVRLAGSYSIQELPCKNLEEAVASELVYSVWIRRRDTHALNRVYIDGLPIFFDHHIAFFAEPKYAHSTAFFKIAPDHGHPLYWRIKEIAGKMDTIRARGVPNEHEKAYHYVNDLAKFKKELEFAEKKVQGINPSDIHEKIKCCGFNEAEAALIENFLVNNLKTLSSDIEQMTEIIFLD